MRVLVCGSRGFLDYDTIHSRLSKLPEWTTIVHGGARGADTLAGDAAAVLGFKVEVFLADWARFGKSASYRQSRQMLDTNPELVIAFWDQSSSGTAHTIRRAERRGIPVDVVTTWYPPVDVISPF